MKGRNAGYSLVIIHALKTNSTFSDPHFPALVAEMEQILSQHMWLFFPATADEE